MKKSDDIRRRTWRMLAKNLIVLVALAVAAAVGVMSWFTNNKKVQADGMTVTAQIIKGLEIAVVAPGASAPADEDYVDDVLALSKSLKIEGTDNYKYPFLQSLQFCEITGDGMFFSRPDIVQNNGIASVDTTKEGYWPLAEADTDYLSFDLYIRSKSQTQVVFASNSTLSPVHALTAGETYSKDSIIGAVRMSVLSSTVANAIDGNTWSDTMTPVLVWLPAPHVYYEGRMGEAAYDTVSLTSTDAATQKHVFYDRTKVQREYTTTDTFFKKSNAGTYALDNSTNIVQLGGSADSNGYYTDFVRVNVWIEGEDSEARLAMVNGEFKLNLILTKGT